MYIIIGHFGKYHNTLCLSPQILHKHCLSLGTIGSPKRNWKQDLCKILVDKQRVLWYFLKWPIMSCRSVMDRWIIYFYSFSVFYQQEQRKKEGEKNTAWVMLLQGHVAGYSAVRPFSIFAEIPKWNTVPYFQGCK